MAHLVIVKPRQIYATTVINALIFKLSNDIEGLRSFICTHKAAVTKEIRDNIKRYQAQMPAELAVETLQNNDEAIEWKNLSKLGYGTAGTDSARGFPALILEPSELGRYSPRHTQDFIEGAMNAHASSVPGNMILADSTSGGEGNYFHEIALSGWKNPKSSWFTAFFGCHEFPEYRLTPPKDFQPDTESIRLVEQFFPNDRAQGEAFAHWRCVKLYEQMRGDLTAFQREFPMIFEEAFQAQEGKLIEKVVAENAAASTTELDRSEPRVMGVDPAGSGDRTAIVERQGYVMDRCQTYPKMDAVSLAEIIKKRIDSGEIDHVFIDMGYGHGTYDILRKSAYGQFVTGVYFGGKASNPKLYFNKRSEMAGEFEEWIKEGPEQMGGTARVPNSQEFLADIRAIPKLEYLNSKVFKLAAKEEIKETLGRSPDIFDAAILTFAFPVRSRRQQFGQSNGMSVQQEKSILTTVNDQNQSTLWTPNGNSNWLYYSYGGNN